MGTTPPTPLVMLLIGRDRTRIRAEIDALRSALPDAVDEHHNGDLAEPEHIVEAAGAIGLLAERRIIIVTGIDAWKAAQQAVVTDALAREDLLRSMLDPMGGDAPMTVIVLIAEKLAANARLRKAVAGATLDGNVVGTVIEAKTPEGSDLVKWVTKEFARHGAKVDAAVSNRLIALAMAGKREKAAADPLGRLSSDIERITTWANGEPITVEVIDALATRLDEAMFWEITESWGSRSSAQLVARAEQLLASDASLIFPMASTLAAHIGEVQHASRLLQDHPQGVVIQRLAANLPPNRQWLAKQTVAKAASMRPAQVEAAFARVVQLEAELRGENPLSTRNESRAVVFTRALAEL